MFMFLLYNLRLKVYEKMLVTLMNKDCLYVILIYCFLQEEPRKTEIRQAYNYHSQIKDI